MKILLAATLLIATGLQAQICKEVLNINGTQVDLSCPEGPPFYALYELYESDAQGDWSGGQKHNCTWPGFAYAWIYSIDEQETCHVITASSKTDFGIDFHDICLGTYYQSGNTTYKNKSNVGWTVGSSFASDENGNNCFRPPGSESDWCSTESIGLYLATIEGDNCQITVVRQRVED